MTTDGNQPGDNIMYQPLPVGTKMGAIVQVASTGICGNPYEHSRHWYPTGNTNEDHEILINVCPGG
jgi:hypothetical protein